MKPTIIKLNTSENNVFWTSDLHFYHKNICNFCPSTRLKFGRDLEKAAEAMIENWNTTVDDDDVVINLGDMFFCKLHQAVPILSQLKGRHIFLCGNHDKVLANNYDAIKSFFDIFELPNRIMELKIDGKNYVAQHYPQLDWNKKHYGARHTFGHVHGQESGVDGSCDVGMDNEEFDRDAHPILIPHSVVEGHLRPQTRSNIQ
jgi:calcineurin-like phosphoesterase family protein